MIYIVVRANGKHLGSEEHGGRVRDEIGRQGLGDTLFSARYLLGAAFLFGILPS